ncbi:MAG: sigma-70 family RNA polymerase sigma factor [Spirochaetes bacterium]|nr:sigma-70 family RNA polymerase sigma factor [Spirochaetota bacterium]
MNKNNEETACKASDEDYSLIRDCLDNNRDSFNRLVLKYKDMVFNLCFRIVADYDEANDCAQEVFIKVYENLNTFKFQAAFSTWLYRIAVNICRNHLSSLKFRTRKKMISLSGGNEETDRPDNPRLSVTDVPDDSYSPEKIYEKKEKKEIVRNAINSMPPKEKILIVLRDIEGRSYEEIAEITGFRMGTVKSGLARARQELRNMLRGMV